MNANNFPGPFGAVAHTVKPIPFKAHRLIGLSDKLLESHYENNYGAAVRRLNAIQRRLNDFDWNRASEFDINGIKREASIAANSMILHEVYFDSIGEDGGEALHGELARAIARDFGGIARWQDEFTALAKALASSSGWVLLVWSERFGRLLNECSNEPTHHLAGALPILALDMYEHAYHIDFGANAAAYIAAFMQNIHWGRVSARFRQAIKPSDRSAATAKPTHLIGVAELKPMLDRSGQKPVVLDVRLSEDRERSGVRIVDTAWRNPKYVVEWAGELPKDPLIVVYCMYGFWVSQETAAELRALGYDARWLEGGIAAWRAMGYRTAPLVP